MYLKFAILSILAVFFAYYLNDSLKESVSMVITKYLKQDKDITDDIKQPDIRVFKDIKRFDGKSSKKLYLAILGDVYDVTEAAQHYGPESTYYGFIGKDASKSFITGSFDGETSSDLRGLSTKDYLGLVHWITFFPKKYKLVGHLQGLYYDENGIETNYRQEILELIKKAQKNKEDDEKVLETYPPCNTKWDEKGGSKVWCTPESGGISRGWAGVPRKQYQHDSNSFRCVCVKENQSSSTNFREYEGCDPKSTSCKVIE